MITTNTNNPQSSLKNFDFETAQAIVLEKYGSTPEDAKKWGFVKKHLGRQTIPRSGMEGLRRKGYERRSLGRI